MGKLIGFSIVGVAVFLGALVVEVTRRGAKEELPLPAQTAAVKG